MQTLEQTVYDMLTENTGRALCDSGDAYGRHWEHNQKKSLADFKAEPVISWDMPDGTEKLPFDSSDLSPVISVYHFLTEHLAIELDDLCHEFNSINVGASDWDSDIYGVSAASDAWLKKHDFTIKGSWNTYNGESDLSQTLQGTNVWHEPTQTGYVLLQLHNGCDVRGGYTDARLFKRTGEYTNDKDGEFLDLNPTIFGTIDGVDVSTAYDGYALTRDDYMNDHKDKYVPVTKDSKIDLYLIDN